jgi:hypothetical protein
MTNRPSAAELRLSLLPMAEKLALAVPPNAPLDYTPESVQRVEQILGAIHDHARPSAARAGLDGVALELAAYIVAVVERNFGPADWQRDDPSFGVDSFPMQWRGRTLYPYAWCQKRLLDGAGDDVWAKFQTLVIDAAAES